MLLLTAGIVIALVLSAMFSGLETAYTAANALRVEKRAREGSKAAAIAKTLLDTPERFLFVTLLGTNVANVSATALMTYLLLQVTEKGAETWTLLILTPVILIWGEMLPKALFRVKADDFSIMFAPFMRICDVILTPLQHIMQLYNKLVMRLTGGSDGLQEEKLFRRRLHMMVREGERADILEDHETHMIQRILQFSGRSLGDVMIPRENIIAVSKSMSRKEVLRIAGDTYYTRFPVMDQNKFIGFINIFDLFYNRGRWQRSIRRLSMRDINTPLGTLVDTMRTGQRAMTAVSRLGQVVGLATLEDIVEMIMGDIENELGRQ
jgi:putative hemolysin